MSTLTAGNGRLAIGSKRGNRRKLASSTPSPGRARAVGRMFGRLVILTVLLAMLGGLSVGLLYGYRYVTSHPYFDIKTISITGNKRLSNGDVLTLAKLKLGMNCLDVNVGTVEDSLFSSPWVEGVTVRREFPSTLHIMVREREPAFWMHKGDVLYYADRFGRVIAPAKPGDYASLPMLSVAPGQEDHGPALAGLNALVGERGGPFGQDQVAWVRFLPSGQMEVFLDRANLTLRMDVKDWRDQLKRIGAVWTDLARRGENRRAAVISAGGDKVWVKLRDDAA